MFADTKGGNQKP